ncbi:MAG: helix-turn-helix transcriptional regulator [Candidatus Pelethousia sp.]|nr:helix-turn-helix transcriptional regulator [Candidatus Pelethousia sp.]
MKAYWDILRELREDRDIKQKTLAALLKTTQQVYSCYERGVYELPIHHLITLCKFYNVSADYILGLSKDQAIK